MDNSDALWIWVGSNTLLFPGWLAGCQLVAWFYRHLWQNLGRSATLDKSNAAFGRKICRHILNYLSALWSSKVTLIPNYISSCFHIQNGNGHRVHKHDRWPHKVTTSNMWISFPEYLWLRFAVNCPHIVFVCSVGWCCFCLHKWWLSRHTGYGEVMGKTLTLMVSTQHRSETWCQTDVFRIPLSDGKHMLHIWSYLQRNYIPDMTCPKTLQCQRDQ